MESIFLYLSASLFLLLLSEVFILSFQFKRKWQKAKDEIEQKIYETEILRELSQRFGYELSVEKVLDIITGSLSNLLPFSVVASMLLSPDSRKKIIFKCHLEESVQRQFIDDIRQRMLSSLTALTNKQYQPEEVSEILTGTIIDERKTAKIASFFNIPVSINNRLVAVLTIASVKPELYKEHEMTILYKIVNAASTAVSKLENVLESEKGKIEDMISSLADGVLMLDKEDRLVIINPQAKKILGLKKKEEVSIFDIIESLAGKFDLHEKIQQSLKHNKLIIEKEVLLNSERFVQILISPVKDINKQILGSVILFHDITTQKELERIREDFTAMMVHELRAPLTVVRGTTDIILSQPKIAIEKSGKELLSSMKGSAETMLSLVNDLLDVAKIEAGKFQIFKSKQNIAAILRERMTFFQNMAEEKGLSLKEEIPGNLPEISLDKERIAQVLNNLISNAIKFTEKGDITLGIIWRSKKRESSPKNEMTVFVKDTGQGIAKEQLGKLFSKFQQLAKPKAEKKGTGLGLAIAKGIVEAHAGKIWAESSLGRGTTFFFTLPKDV